MYKIIFSIAVIVFVAIGGYVGYLGALVSLDEIAAEREYVMEDELYKVDQQVKQMESLIKFEEVLIERNAEELAKLQEEELALLEREKELETVAEEDLEVFKSQLLGEQVSLNERLSTRRTRADREARITAAQESRLSRAKQAQLDRRAAIVARREAREVDTRSFVEKIVDKAGEIDDKEEEEAVFSLDWSKRPGTIPSSIRISVNDKTGRNTELNQVHVNQLAAALSLMPDDFTDRLVSITIVYGDSNMRRGMSGFKTLFIKGENLDIFRVLVHEFGHIYDLYQEVRSGDGSVFHHGTYQIPQPDPTVTYYKYGWKDDFNTLYDKLAYSSGYARSIPPEDFAETFALYVLQGQTFRNWAAENEVIAEKYEFLKNVVYDGKEFQSTTIVGDRPYDVTKIPVNYNDLF